MRFTLDDFAWYVIVTLRDSCIEGHLQSLRKYYPAIKVYVVDNNIGKYDISKICEKYGAEQIINDDLLPLTMNQIKHSPVLFQKHKVLCFSSDDVVVLDRGFIERSMAALNQGKEIVSFSTDADPVAYAYTENFFKDVGFNDKLLGKECTDTELVRRTRNRYAEFPSVGMFWRGDERGWHSKYVLNPHCGVFGKTEVNQQLEDLGINSGRETNRDTK
jgi:hypothetical protein